MKTTNTFATEQEYKEARMKNDANSEAVKQYCKDHKTNGIPISVSDTFPFANDINNELRSKIEVWEFLHDKPENYFLYINEKEKTATTWTGDILGNVRFGKEWRSSFGDTRVSVDIYADNGLTYRGTYFKSSGDYARIKLSKHSKTIL